MKNGQAVIKDGAAVVDAKARKPFFAFNRSAFGIVMVRTDGKRLLVYTNSGQAKMKEAYGYEMDQFGKPKPAQVRQVSSPMDLPTMPPHGILTPERRDKWH